MPTVVGTDHRGREVSTLDLDVKQRLGLLRKLIAIHEKGQQYRDGKERGQFVEREIEHLQTSHTLDERAYLEKIISPDIPLEQETHPEFMPQRQRGGFPTTLRDMEANYVKHIEQEGAKNGR